MLDLHVHTRHSCDSTAGMEEYCTKAIAMGLEYICFTDHIDCNRNDNGYGFYNPVSFFEEFKRAREKYSGELNILSGIEFAEPHIYEREFEAYRKLPYDFILGSIHFWYEDMFPSQMIKENIPVETAFEKYWEEVCKAVDSGGFDSLAHMDFPKRYYGKNIWTKDIIQNIFRTMVKQDIALEINTSSLRKGLAETMPGGEMLALYEECGGVRVTIGADTHTPDDLAKGYSQAASLIAGKFENTVFIGRQPRKVTSD